MDKEGSEEQINSFFFTFIFIFVFIGLVVFRQ